MKAGKLFDEFRVFNNYLVIAFIGLTCIVYILLFSDNIYWVTVYYFAFTMIGLTITEWVILLYFHHDNDPLLLIPLSALAVLSICFICALALSHCRELDTLSDGKNVYHLSTYLDLDFPLKVELYKCASIGILCQKINTVVLEGNEGGGKWKLVMNNNQISIDKRKS